MQHILVPYSGCFLVVAMWGCGARVSFRVAVVKVHVVPSSL